MGSIDKVAGDMDGVYRRFVRLSCWNRVLQCVAVWCSVVQCVAVCCSALQCVAACCSVLQCVAVCLVGLSCCHRVPSYDRREQC